MNRPPTPEERVFIHILFETYNQMRAENDKSIAHEAIHCDSLKWNIPRDERKKAHPFFLTMRRKCEVTGLSFAELVARTEQNFKAWQKEEALKNKK